MADLQIVLASKNVEAQYVEMMVPLYSYGCERKVKKALAHLKGIYSVNVDFSQQKVTVWGICNKYDVLGSIRNKRKEARFWNPEDNVALEESQTTPSSPSSPCPRPRPRPRSSAKAFALIRGRSMSWKVWKKVFVRSYSF